MAEQSLTYSGAGVDITKGNQAVELMKPLVKSTFRKEHAVQKPQPLHSTARRIPSILK